MASTNMIDLTKRRLFNHNTNDTCRSFSVDNQAQPITGSLSFHDLMTYISAGALVLTCLITFLLALGHIFNYREPRVQKQLIRILWTPPVFAIFSFFGVWKFHLTNYFTPIPELYEVFALVAVFYLMMALLIPQAGFDAQINFFSQTQHGGYGTFAKRYMLIMQVIPVHIITLVAVEVITAIACVGGKAYRHGNTIVSIINGASNAFALMALLRMLFQFKTSLKAADSTIMKKLISFKLIVFIQFVQRIVFSILSSANALNGTKTLSYNDLNLGLNSFLLCVEVMIIAFLMIPFYWPRQYKHNPVDYEAAQGMTNGQQVIKEQTPMMNAGPKPRLGFFRAIFDALDMLDIIQGLFRALQLWSRRGSTPSSGYYQQTQPQNMGYDTAYRR